LCRACVSIFAVVIVSVAAMELLPPAQVLLGLRRCGTLTELDTTKNCSAAKAIREERAMSIGTIILIILVLILLGGLGGIGGGPFYGTGYYGGGGLGVVVVILLILVLMGRI
jgi:hypothetical protein